MSDDDPENINKNSIQCNKCGCMKVEGVHHCSACGRCVYKMDHHCPWTDHCVGYLTLKPFLLFLMYVTIASFITVVWMYQAARSNYMSHISFIAFIPSYQLKYMLTMKYGSEMDKQIMKDDADKQWKAEKDLGGDPDDIFSW